MDLHAERRWTASANLQAADSIGTQSCHYGDDEPGCSSRHEGMCEDRERVIDTLPDIIVLLHNHVTNSQGQLMRHDEPQSVWWQKVGIC
jgi:hypothetical protein